MGDLQIIHKSKKEHDKKTAAKKFLKRSEKYIVLEQIGVMIKPA